MGRQVSCTGTVAGEAWEGVAELETDSVILRGKPRRILPFAAITGVAAADGRLHLDLPLGAVVLNLGPPAADWASRIQNPPTRLDKLGVKGAMATLCIGVTDGELAAELESAGARSGGDDEPLDLIFFQADEPGELAQLASLRERLKPAGGVWVITPRGRPEIIDVVVIKAGLVAGLVDVKVCRFNSTHTALKFVIPKAERK